MIRPGSRLSPDTVQQYARNPNIRVLRPGVKLPDFQSGSQATVAGPRITLCLEVGGLRDGRNQA